MYPVIELFRDDTTEELFWRKIPYSLFLEGTKKRSILLSYITRSINF